MFWHNSKGDEHFYYNISATHRFTQKSRVSFVHATSFMIDGYSCIIYIQSRLNILYLPVQNLEMTTVADRFGLLMNSRQVIFDS